ncbi:MAG: hypothetical protein HPY68_06815 [Candidatus Atribacteria bacterium]|nr:hypothetical protein [Candidatus Atribacteria bacterium]
MISFLSFLRAIPGPVFIYNRFPLHPVRGIFVENNMKFISILIIESGIMDVNGNTAFGCKMPVYLRR